MLGLLFTSCKYTNMVSFYIVQLYSFGGDYLLLLMFQMSGSRMKVAGRFKPCVHMGCFDLEVFVEMSQRSRKARN